ncbi:MAG: O-antigen ligase family protein, partial [Thermomicrobiaceae bacterium]|nr:O-antigen ligase family protein [Thermomicrobiaceae bacterium]
EVVITPDNFAAVERMAHWQAGIAMFRAYPLTGVGIGNYNVRYPEFYVHPGFTVSRGHAHNYYIQAAAETGIIGLAAYVILILSALATSLRAALRSPTEIGKALGIGAVGVTAAVMVHNVVEDLHVLNLGVQLAAVWALAALATRRGHDWDREGARGQVSAR